ncbi:MAG: hypothetical protein ACYTGQ_00900 [Planctomycetota bacterium]|jgi:uncharacterized membrane protein
MDTAKVVIRILHTLSAIMLMGGVGMMIMCVLPAIKQTEASLMDTLVPAVRKRFFKIAVASIVLLLLTGFAQWGLNHGAYEVATPLPNIVLGFKMLRAFAVFIVFFGLNSGVIRGCPKKWMTISFGMATLVVILAAVTRQIRLGVLYESFDAAAKASGQ